MAARNCRIGQDRADRASPSTADQIHSAVIDRFDSASQAKDLTLPVLLIHGSDDEIIPTQMSRTLATLFPNATLRVVPGAHHNDLIDRPDVLEALIGFARQQAAE